MQVKKLRVGVWRIAVGDTILI